MLSVYLTTDPLGIKYVELSYLDNAALLEMMKTA